MTTDDNFIKALARANAHLSQKEFRCVCCKTNLPLGQMTTDPRCHGWCVDCDEHEKEACRRDAQNDRDGWDDPRCPYCADTTCGGWCA